MRTIRRALEIVLVLAALSLAPTGCVKTTFSSPGFRPTEHYDVWLDRYLYGIVGSQELDTRRYCTHGVAAVRVFDSGWTIWATILSLGVYTPAVARVTCGVALGRAEPAPCPTGKGAP